MIQDNIFITVVGTYVNVVTSLLSSTVERLRLMYVKIHTCYGLDESIIRQNVMFYSLPNT